MGQPLMALMIDLCAGLGGASRAFRDAGWNVLTLDYNPDFLCDITADVRTWSWHGSRPDFIWASPPCDEFSREFMPWSKTGKTPDMSITLACKRIIDETRPRYWCIENVRGSVRWFEKYFGRPSAIVGPFFLWGNFPPLGEVALNMQKKESMSSSWAEVRAIIPLTLSKAMLRAVSLQLELIT